MNGYDCAQCGAAIPFEKGKKGRPRKYCSDSCRSASWLGQNSMKKEEVVKLLEILDKSMTNKGVIGQTNREYIARLKLRLNIRDHG